jgi:hypothetical protein
MELVMVNTFKRDLERGVEVERMVLEIIRKKNPCATLVDAFKGYDIWIPELHKSVEVKYDEMSAKTGNICIEIEFNQKASALLTTTADWWVIYDGEKYMRFTPMQIIQCIFMNHLRYAEFIGAGDNKSKKLFLIKKDVLYPYGVEINAN